MKLQILSDLHIDSYARQSHPMGHIPKTDADVLLVAGDTANSDNGMPWLQEQAARLQIPLLTILQCQHFDIGEVRILGCTLWTDYQYQANEDTMAAARRFMRDYKQIYAGNDLFSPEVSMQIHAEQRQWLKKALITSKGLGKTTVVMSHHSVSALSVSEKYASLPSNAAFVSDFSGWMHEDWAPTLWVHGHTHEAFDYRIGNTRVIVNPRAYPNEVSSTEIAFAWNKVIDIG